MPASEPYALCFVGIYCVANGHITYMSAATCIACLALDVATNAEARSESRNKEPNMSRPRTYGPQYQKLSTQKTPAYFEKPLRPYESGRLFILVSPQYKTDISRQYSSINSQTINSRPDLRPPQPAQHRYWTGPHNTLQHLEKTLLQEASRTCTLRNPYLYNL